MMRDEVIKSLTTDTVCRLLLVIILSKKRSHSAAFGWQLNAIKTTLGDGIWLNLFSQQKKRIEFSSSSFGIVQRSSAVGDNKINSKPSEKFSSIFWTAGALILSPSTRSDGREEHLTNF